ncbi:ATP-binding response regulator [Roseateles oligotrophus]|uniref:histidine kinase n=1 Tax=Roseateles oligotrophus TaxID=1769250 RepID=A0ABT2YFR9_9BURK|nr:hybrid sensor histidine kinase/response regulator [Roseateles oligotrophus]MCV2368892.1 hybrid sensor histidine kinase/response regulator [Roseateles oligotrophus]
MFLEILIVDDIFESRHELAEQVTALGHRVSLADSGMAALALLQHRLPDLVLLDLLMPELDGFEVTRRLRELTGRHWVPVIATSGLQGEEHVIQALKSGADDYLSRPVNPHLLEAKLRHYGAVLALQSRLARRAQRERDILDNILDPVLTLNASGNIEECNRSALGLLRQDGQPLRLGDACLAVLGLDLPALLAQPECQLRAADGTLRPFELGLSEWREALHVHYTVVLHDLSAQRQVERMKDEFLATVSHELRTPLTSVLGALGLLAGGAAGALPAPALALAQVAQRNGERLSGLIDDVLDLTKLEGDRLQLYLRPQPLYPLLREALAANQGYADRAGVRLLHGIPEQEAGPELRLDGERFLQLMANLLSNAIKHSPPGEAVRLIVSVDAYCARISVRDRGPGIAPAFRARMFEKFSQADGSDRRAQGGTGLGLYISRLLVERMGGRISADEPQDAGSGACFSVEFELAGRAQTEVTALPRILHIDADLEIRERVQRWLSPVALVDSAAHLGQADALLALHADTPYRLLIGSPQDQGAALAFCAGLRRLAQGRPAMLYGDSVDQAFCKEAGLPWLSPARSGPAELLAMVQQLMKPAASQQAKEQAKP